MQTKLRTPALLTLTILLSLAALPQRANAADPPEPRPWPPVVHILATDAYASEQGTDPASYEIFRIGPTNEPLTVLFRIGGVAVLGTDYNLVLPDGAVPAMQNDPAGPLYSIVVPAGAFSAPLFAVPVDDYEVEGWEHVVLALEQPAIWPPPYIVDWPSVAAAYIEDNDPASTNQPPRVAIVNPPDGSVFAGVESIALVARASDTDGRVRTVEFFDGTTSLGIVTNRPWPIIIPTDRTKNTLLAADPEFLPDPTVLPSPIPLNLFRLAWQNPPPGRHILTAVATDNEGAATTSEAIHIVVIEHSQTVVNVRATDPEATEPTDTARLDTATFTIFRTGPTNFPLTVWYKLDGTASNGEDYSELPSTATIPGGARSVDVIVKPLPDKAIEGDESVVLTIVPPICIDIFPPPPDCYLVGSAATAKAVIHDSNAPNQPPIVRIVRPLDGSIFVAPADIRIVAQVWDPDGYWVRVEFFEGANSIGVISNSPAPVLPGMLWSNVPPGRYVLTAVALDNDGGKGRSFPVDVLVVPPPNPPVVNIEATDPIATESSMLPIDSATFTVTRSGDTSEDLVVFYSIGGTASNGADYRELPGRVLLPKGAASAEVVVIPLPDNLVEGSETVALKLEPPPYLAATDMRIWYIIGTNDHARAVIRDINVPPTNLPPKVAIVSPQEGDIFEAHSNIPIYAAACDPDGFVKTVEFFEGNNSLGIVSNRMTTAGNDGSGGISPLPEQTFRFLWENVPPGRYELSAVATDNKGASAKSAPVFIRVTDVQTPPIVTIYATDPQASEGPMIITNRTILPEGGIIDPPSTLPDTATFKVRRSGRTNEDLTVFYSVTGTGSPGEDYRLLSGEVTIPRGAYSADIVVIPIDDRLIEGRETVIVTLDPIACIAVYPPPPGCYVVGDPDTATAYILDNDINHSPSVEIVRPASGSLFKAPADIDIEVVARDPDGWVGQVDFFADSKLIGSQSIYFLVPPPPGQVQTFSMTWSNVPPGKYVLTVKAYDNLGGATISDPIRIGVLEIVPVPVVTVIAADSVATETDPRSATPVIDTATFTVKRTGDLTQPLRVFYRVGGTASNGVDYLSLLGQVEIPQNATTADIIVAPIDDELVEGTESVVLSLVQPCDLSTDTLPGLDCYLVGQPGRAVAYIRDNDASPNNPPRVALISPANGAIFTAPADIRLVATAQDSDGWVQTVEFFANGRSLGIITNRPWIIDPVRMPDLSGAVIAEPSLTPTIPIPPPFILLWANVPPGRYELIAVATDNLGASAKSAPVGIAVLEPSHVPVVTIMAVDSIAREGSANPAAFRVRRTGPTNDSLSVLYSIRGSAENGRDYLRISGMVTIPAGRRSARIIINPIDDNIREQIETVILQLQPSLLDVYPPPSYVGRPGSAAAIILDKDCPNPPSTRLPDGNFHIRLPMPDGLPCRLEATSDFLAWEPVLDQVVTDEGLDYIEPDSNTAGHRFYRVIPELDLQMDD